MFRQTKRGSGKDMLVGLALIALVLASCAMSGCAALVPQSVGLEFEHISHPQVGWPVGQKYRDEWYGTVRAESEVNNVNLMGKYRGREGWYVDAGLGVNVFGNDGSGFFGPTVVGTLRAGWDFKVRKE